MISIPISVLSTVVYIIILYILLINKMNNAKLLHLMVYILTIILGWACTEVDITMPKGPKGDRGMSE